MRTHIGDHFIYEGETTLSCAIVYSNKTGNPELLAHTIKNVFPSDECMYLRNVNPKVPKADKIFIGFWTAKGHCDKDTAEFYVYLLII